MRFTVVDDLLSRQMTGEVRSPAAEHLGLRLERWARGVAVYEMPLRSCACSPYGRVENGVLTALAEAAMTAAATTIVDDGGEPLATRSLTASFERPVLVHEAPALRAEAIVMRRAGAVAFVEADVLCNGERVATFSSTCAAVGAELEVAA